jgi:hypothetical protein
VLIISHAAAVYRKIAHVLKIGSRLAVSNLAPDQ